MSSSAAWYALSFGILYGGEGGRFRILFPPGFGTTEQRTIGEQFDDLLDDSIAHADFGRIFIVDKGVHSLLERKSATAI